jgi:hypothetical protein
LEETKDGEFYNEEEIEKLDEDEQLLRHYFPLVMTSDSKTVLLKGNGITL